MNYSVKDLASYLGVTRQLVNIHCKKGNLHRDSRGKIDSEDPFNKEWIAKRVANPMGHKPVGKNPARGYIHAEELESVVPEDAEQFLENLSTTDLLKLPKSEIDKLKAMESMLKTQVERKHKRRELIERALVTSVFGKLFTIDSNEWKPLGAKISADLAGICGCDDPEKVLLVEKRIDDEVARILAHSKREMDDALKSWEPK